MTHRFVVLACVALLVACVAEATPPKGPAQTQEEADTGAAAASKAPDLQTDGGPQVDEAPAGTPAEPASGDQTSTEEPERMPGLDPGDYGFILDGRSFRFTESACRLADGHGDLLEGELMEAIARVRDDSGEILAQVMIEQDRIRSGGDLVVESTPRYSRFSVILMPSSDDFEFYTGTIVEDDAMPLFGGRALELNGVARDFTESADELGALFEAGVEEIPIEEWIRLSRTGDVNWQVRMPCEEDHYMEDLIN